MATESLPPYVEPEPAKSWRKPAVRWSGWAIVAVAAILLAAAAFRLLRLATLPPGLFQDEAVNAVNAQTILAGSPQIYYGEREPLYMYWTAFWMLVLGPTPVALRASAALAGVVGVAAGGAFARQLFGRVIGLLTAAGLAASLWLTIISRVGFRAITFPAVECLGLALLWRATRTGRRRDFAVSGLVLGLSLYTYLAARFLPFALVLFVVVSFILDRRWMLKQLPGFIIAGIGAVIVCLPLGAYALKHPEMLFGRPDQVALAGGAAFFPALIANVGRTLGMLLFHGDLDWRQNFSGAAVFDPLNGLVFLCGVLIALWIIVTRRDVPRWNPDAGTQPDARPAALLMLILAVVMLAPSMLSIDSPHYLRTSGAAVAVYALWALGLAGLARLVARLARWKPASIKPGLFAGAFVAVTLLVAYARTTQTYFVRYAQDPAVPPAFNANLAAAGRFLATSPIWQHDPTNVFVTDKYEVNRASVAFFLYRELRPAERANWLDPREIGSFFAQDKAIPLPVAPSLYVVDGNDYLTLAALGPAIQRTARIQGDGRLAGTAIWATPAPTDAFGEPVDARFGRWLELERVRIEPDVVGLRWRILAVPDYQPSVFLHVQDAQQHTLATADQVIGFPVQDWRVSQEFVTWHAIHLPSGTPPGQYALTAGVYRKETGAREPATLAGHTVADVSVGQLTLDRPVAGPVEISHAVNQMVAPGLTLVGADLGTTTVDAGTKLPLVIAWQASGASRANETAIISARSASGAVGEWQGPIGTPAYPTGEWPGGTEIRQLVDLPIAATASGAAVVVVSVHPVGGSSAAAAVSPVTIGQFTIKASSHQFIAPHPEHPLQAGFAGVGTLIGADLPTHAVHPGDQLNVTLYWQSQGNISTAYTVFVHLLDAHNKVVAQRDEPPVHGTRPTTSWVPGEYITDEHEISLSQNLAPGTYPVEIGLYDPRTGKRVTVGSSDNRVILGSVTVVAPSGAAAR